MQLLYTIDLDLDLVSRLLGGRSRVMPRRCANLSLRYRLRNSIQLALTLLFTFKTKRMTVSCFVFGVQYVCHHTGKAKPDVKLFGVLGRRVEERKPQTMLAFDYPLKGRFPYILRFASVVYMYINSSFSLHPMSLPRV